MASNDFVTEWKATLVNRYRSGIEQLPDHCFRTGIHAMQFSKQVKPFPLRESALHTLPICTDVLVC
jgi:hypothetical protein